jgi:hypothetical protein
VLLNIPGFPPEVQIRVAVMAHYDGKGNSTHLEHLVFNGMPPDSDWKLNSSATYTVNPDCTGKIVDPNDPDPKPTFFVVVRQGKEIRYVGGTNAVISVESKID